MKIERFWTKFCNFLVIITHRLPWGLNFGFGFGLVWLFYKSLGSGLSGFIFKLRVLGFSGTRGGTNMYAYLNIIGKFFHLWNKDHIVSFEKDYKGILCIFHLRKIRCTNFRYICGQIIKLYWLGCIDQAMPESWHKH